MSRTVLKLRDKYNNSRFGANGFGDEISVDGISISAQKYKPRALSNLKTINGYGGSRDSDSSIYIKKNYTPGMMSPKRTVLDELNWEDRQKLLGMSMNKVNSLKKEDILRAITLPDATSSSNYQYIRKFQNQEEPQIDEALKRLVAAGEYYPSMREYARVLIKKWDTNNDGIISFQEVCDGFKQMDIQLQLKDRVALMKKLDLNKDGAITEEEMYKVLSGYSSFDSIPQS